MVIELLHMKPTQRRWLPVGRARDERGRLTGFTLCWWTGMVVVLIHRRKGA